MIAVLGGLWDDAPPAFGLLLTACLVFVVLGLRLCLIDIRVHLLPNRIVFPFAALALALLLSVSLVRNDGATALRTILAGAVLWAGYLTLRFISPDGMGFGDVKLAFVLGLYLGFVGWAPVLWGTVAAFLLGSAWGVWLILSGRGSGKTQIAFGPFMIVGAAIALAAS